MLDLLKMTCEFFMCLCDVCVNSLCVTKSQHKTIIYNYRDY